MISCNHNTASIGLLLIKFKSFVIKNKSKWLLFKHAVTDFSFALLNSISYFWNMSLKNYIHETYLYITQKSEMSSGTVFFTFVLFSLHENDSKRCKKQ